MATSPLVIKHPLRSTPATGSAPDPAEDTEAPEASDFLSGIIRDERTRLQTRPFTVDGPDWSSKSSLPSPESNTTPLSSPDLDVLRAAWEAEWRQKAAVEREAAVTAAREKAYAEGVASARAEWAAGREAERTAFAKDVAHLRALWEHHLTTVDPLLVGLAVEVAEAVLDGPLGADALTAMTEAITHAVERLAAQPPLVVTLHPVDHLRLQEAGMVDALTATHPGLRWVPDPTLTEGDWSLDAAGTAVRRIRAEVLHDLRRRLSLEPDPPLDTAAS